MITTELAEFFVECGRFIEFFLVAVNLSNTTLQAIIFDAGFFSDLGKEGAA